MKRIIFIHSPIQNYIAHALLKEKVLSLTDSYIYHRNQSPESNLIPQTEHHPKYILNDLISITRIIYSDTSAQELILPHSLSFAYFLGLNASHILRISYIEEGISTINAIRNPRATDKTTKKRLGITKRFQLAFYLALNFGLKGLSYYTSALIAHRASMHDNTNLLIDHSSPKTAKIYCTAAWSKSPMIYTINHPIITLQPRAQKILVAIGKSEINHESYWSMLEKISSTLRANNIAIYFKAHPKVKLQEALRKSHHSERFLSNATSYSPGARELGTAIVEDGFLGAVSFFSSYQIYAHQISSAHSIKFPLLSLESAVLNLDLSNQTRELGDINLEKCITLNVNDWISEIIALATACRT